MFKRSIVTLAVAAVVGLSGCNSEDTNSGEGGDQPEYYKVLDYVDPFVGTGPDGHTFPGAVYPSGMVQLSPDITMEGWGSAAGYFDDGTIHDIPVYGFSHTHLSGTGITDLGDILILPYADQKNAVYNTFDKDSESATPGYYSMLLKRDNIKAELTASPRVGYHKYSFAEDQIQFIKLDLAHTLNASWGNDPDPTFNEIEIIDEYTVRGHRKSNLWAKNQSVYFYAKFSSPIISSRIVADDIDIDLSESSGNIEANEIVSYFEFAPSDKPLEVRLAISPTSVQGAQLNLEAEVPDWGFDNVLANAQKTWADELSSVAVEGGTATEKTNFYTALYHTQIAPMIFQDVDGQYRAMDPEQTIKQADETPNYTIYSMWDTFRAFHPLQTVINPDKAQDYVNDLIRKQQDGGLLPKWELHGHYTGTMVGYPAVSIIADAVTKGFEVDINDALHALKETTIYDLSRFPDWDQGTLGGVQNIQMQDHINLGIVPHGWWNSASYGIEYSYYDWAVSEVAAIAGDEVTKQEYQKRSQYYLNYWDPQERYFRAVNADGSFYLPEGETEFDPYLVDEFAFTEGNAWQWKWQIFHDFDNLETLIGGPDQFKQDLLALFEADESTSGEDLPDMTGFIGQYMHGNEPSHHIAYLWNRTDEAWRTQEYLDRVMREFYTPTPDGLIGNEDVGQMSAWYVLSAMGFYQVTPGIPEYTIGRPLFSRVEIKLPDGVFTITANNNSPANKYVKEVTINGVPLGKNWTFKHSDITAGGELRFEMTGKKPAS
ncbi:GH92 family glycosyl hydrolase [Psychromonas aquimarina]|uniref:GH92 family glycosyl hydrolase n=1 Tax=Psychromonas aquimarina TaxID=444919 RepID=UPI0004123F23|nr:GH92 family glycosyl hydrolase [Psychromonas aquimarina]